LGLKETGRKVSLYSISSNPLLSNEFCVSGRDEYVRIYDIRKLSRSTVSTSGATSDDDGGTENESVPLKRFCPHHLQGHQSKPHITAAVYN
jgi:WD repeat-containing protein 42A